MQLYQAILAGKIEYPRHIKKEARCDLTVHTFRGMQFTLLTGVNSCCRDLISKLLTSDLSRRLGNLKDGAKDIRNHPWFKGLMV
jgi:hypothetical protein